MAEVLNEEVISFVENDINLYKISSIISKSLVTKKVKKLYFNSIKGLKIETKFEFKDNNCLFSICGKEREEVIESKAKFNEIIAFKSVVKRPFTHLITVPFTSQPLRQQFIEFKDNVLMKYKDSEGMAESLFQKPYKLHLTFCVLILQNQSHICLAKEVLRQSMDQIVRPLLKDQSLKISVEGLDVMKGSPERAHVVYAKIIDDSNRLQTIANQIVGQYVKSGLLEDSSEPEVKLHITFMNSLFRRSERRNKRMSFNAKEIIDSYISYKFCDTFVESIQLNDINTKTKDGFYGLVDAIDLTNRGMDSSYH